MKHYFPASASLSNPAANRVKPSFTKVKTPISEADYNVLKKLVYQSIDLEQLTFNDSQVIRAFNQHLSKKSKLGVLQPGADEAIEPEQEMHQFKEFYPRAYSFLAKLRGGKLEKSVFDYIKLNYSSLVPNLEKPGVTNSYIHNGVFDIRGRVDGIDLSRRTLVEIKTRNKFSFSLNTMLDSDQVQVQVYMKMFGCTSCLFVECGPSGRRSLKETLVKYDEEQFNEYMSRVQRFCEFGARSLDDELARFKHQNVIYI
jgi:hypothetical protein